MGKVEKVEKFYCYMLLCNDNTIYTGYTTNLKNRLKNHNSGFGGRYTSTRRPCLLAYYEEYDDKSSAMKREYFIKHHLTRKDKLQMIRGMGILETEGKIWEII